ncbi:MAG TPA: hypothetical protein VJ822_00805, partial [Dongiaceae bacterium]|nr:hypothetical protein [Dongiaceae bacterium]
CLRRATLYPAELRVLGDAGRSRTILDPLGGIKPRFVPNLQDYQALAGSVSILRRSVDPAAKTQGLAKHKPLLSMKVCT